MIKVDSEFYLDHFLQKDKHRLAETISDAEIARNTLTIPYPYKLEDAQWWLQQQDKKNERQKSWAIRNKEGQVCGSIGRHFKYGADSHKDELGYWLMRLFWGKGLMTKVLQKFTQYCFEKEALKRLEAPIFEFNIASARVLEKSGFQLEAKLRKAYLKDGQYYDSLLYAKISE